MTYRETKTTLASKVFSFYDFKITLISLFQDAKPNAITIYKVKLEKVTYQFSPHVIITIHMVINNNVHVSKINALACSALRLLVYATPCALSQELIEHMLIMSNYAVVGNVSNN